MLILAVLLLNTEEAAHVTSRTCYLQDMTCGALKEAGEYKIHDMVVQKLKSLYADEMWAQITGQYRSVCKLPCLNLIDEFGQVCATEVTALSQKE